MDLTLSGPTHERIVNLEKIVYSYSTKMSELYSFYIFNKEGKCTFFLKGEQGDVHGKKDEEESKKLVFGMTFSLRNLCGKLAPEEGSENLQVLRTNNFAIHHFMSATGLVFILCTDVACPSQYNRLKAVYSNLYTEYVSKNYLFEGQSVTIESPVFRQQVERFFGQA